MKGKWRHIFLFVYSLLFVLIFSISVIAADINTWVSPTTATVTTGETTSTTLYIKNQGSVWPMTCSKIDIYHNDIYQSSETINIEISAGKTQTKTMNVQAPSVGSGTLNVKFKVYCEATWDKTPNTQFSDTFAVSYSPPSISFTVVPSKSEVSLLAGKSETIVITVTNTMSSATLSCTRVDTGANLGSIAAGSSVTYNFNVQAPSTGSGTIYSTASVICSYAGTSATKSTTITVNYQQDPCIAALADARSAISDAQTAITNAGKKIQEANKIGADIADAKAALNDANSYLSTAQTTLTTAQSSCDAGDRTNGVTQANSAKQSALDAKTYATTALNEAEKSIKAYEEKKKAASDEISDANSAIDNAIMMVNNAEDILENATALSNVMPEALGGLDLITHKSNVNTARAKLDQAKNYIKDAQIAFDQDNFDLAKSKAESASKYATEANDLATDSYNKIDAVMMTLGEAAKAIMAAGTEISQTDEILTKMNYIAVSVEEWGVNLTEAKSIVSTGQTNIDEAKDLLTQAKNRLQAGMSSEAVDKAVAARDKAAEPTNRLNRIVNSMSLQTQDALKKAYADAEQKIANAENAVTSAANTYAATQSEVISAQNDLAIAKSQLANASTAIKEVKTATDLTTFLTKASLAFSALDDTTMKVTSAIAHANSAKMGLITKVVIPATAGAGVVGGGFLFWRIRKKKKVHPVKEAKRVAKELEEEAEKEWKMFCKTCKKEYSALEKFCSVCGKKLEKIVKKK